MNLSQSVRQAAVIAVFIIWSGRGVSAAVSCDQLATLVNVNVGGVPDTIIAGTDLEVEANAKANAEVFESWPSVIVSFVLTNGINGSANLDWALELDLEQHTVNDTLQSLIPINFGGKYTLRANVFGFGANGGYCGKPITISSGGTIGNPSIDITNDPSSIDILPPVITSTTFSRSEYGLSDNITITFTALDNSPICTKDKVDAGLCKAVQHVELTNLSTNDRIDASPFVVNSPEGHYLVSFILPCGVKPGKYTVNIIDVQDVFGNGAADVPVAARSEVIIANKISTVEAIDGQLPLVNAKDPWDLFLESFDSSQNDSVKMRAAWDCFESKFSPVYEDLVYNKGSNPQWQERKTQKLDAFFAALPSFRQQATKVFNDFDSILKTQSSRFFSYFPNASRTTKVYALPSLLYFNGMAGSLSSDPDMALFFGVDFMSQRSDDPNLLFAHEFFHVYHFATMHQSSTKTLAFPLWTEGLATFVSGVLNPESNDDSSLLLDADLGAKCGDAAYVHELAQKYLSIADMSNSIEEAVPVFEDWFLLRGQTLPKRRGYCLGLKVASKIAETHTLAEMISWNAEESLVEIKKALQQL